MNDMSRLIKFPISSICESYSISTGYAQSGKGLIFFTYASTFYVEFKEILVGKKASSESLTILVDFAVNIIEYGTLQAVIINKDDRYFLPHAAVAFSNKFLKYKDRVCFAIMLQEYEIEALAFGGRLRILIFNDSDRPRIVEVLGLALAVTSARVDVEYQMGDQSPASLEPGFHDGLLGHRLAGWTPLHFAAHWNHEDWVYAMLLDGYSPDAPEINGATALHRAADMNHLDVASILVRAGANPNALDSSLGETPLDCAIRKGHVAVADLILNHGGSRAVDGK